MDKTKILVALLALSLCGNIYLLATSGNPPATEGISQFILYAYHQAFPPIENGTLLQSGNESKSTGVDDEMSDKPSDTMESTGRDSLPPVDKTEVSEETLLQLLHSMENETRSIEEQKMEPEATPTPDPNAWKVYESSNWHFSISYPPTWTVEEGTSSSPAVTFTAPVETMCSAETKQCYQYVASLSIAIDSNPGTGGLEEYFNKKISTLQKQLGITATSKSAPTYISGERAYWIEYYTRDARGNPSKRYMQYFALLDGKIYLLTYSGPYSTKENVYSANKDEVQKMIESFTVKREYVVV